MFTGTPKAAGFDKKGQHRRSTCPSPARTKPPWCSPPTGVLTGPGTADQAVPEDKKAAVLAAFTSTMPGQKLPFGLAPTSEGARGSDIIIEGIAEGVTVTLE